MAATQETTGSRLKARALALLLLLLAALAAPAQARSAPENRAGEKSAQNPELLLSPTPQLLELQRENATAQRYDASGDSFAPKYVNNNPKATAGEVKVGEMLNGEAQAGKLPGVKEVQGAAESGVKGVRSGDYRFVNENGTVSSADLLQSSSARAQNVFTNILDKAGQAETVVVELLPPKAGAAITNEAAAQIATDVLNTSENIKRVIFVRDGKIVVDKIK